LAKAWRLHWLQNGQMWLLPAEIHPISGDGPANRGHGQERVRPAGRCRVDCLLRSLQDGGDRSKIAFGRIDILVANAGREPTDSCGRHHRGDWHYIVDTNLKGTSFSCQAVARHMIPRKKGKIITIGSLTSFMGYPMLALTQPAGVESCS